MKFLAFQENTASTFAADVVGETILQPDDRQAGVVGVARLEGTPAGDFDLQRNVLVGQA